MAQTNNPYQQMAPQFTQPMQQVIPQIQQTQQTQPASPQLPTVGVFWVPGIAGAQGFNQAANTEAYFRDSNENDILYIKTTDQFGRLNKLEKYRMVKESIEDPSFNDSSNFITVDQLNDILDDKFEKLVSKLNRPQPVQGGKRNNGSKRNNKPRNEEDENYDE